MSEIATSPKRVPVWATLLGMTALGLGGTLIGYLAHPNKMVGVIAGGAIGFALSMLLFAYVKNRESKLKLAGGACGTATPAASKFGAALGVWMAIYCLDIVLISWVFDIEAWPVALRAVAAITPAIPIGGVIFALLTYAKTEPDEYQRMLLTRAVLIAMGWTFFVLTAWGFLELYIDAPSFPVAFVMCPFWFFFGASNWWVKKRNGWANLSLVDAQLPLPSSVSFLH